MPSPVGAPVACRVEVADLDYVVVDDDGGSVVEVPAAGHTVRLVVTALAPVRIGGLRVEVVGREPGGGVLERQAADLSERDFEVCLTDQSPRILPLGGIGFPLELERHDREVVALAVRVGDGDVRWRLWLEWSTRVRSGSLPVDLGGRPFRTVARHDVVG
ncbi:hypothetical protein [Actinoplanes rectilineatus]|uniref:hypothetical protein n=1 Tax=Actinoplanes rectilineatus TaxID=113571 RepID=UPI0014701E9D|nr:hypothetical protein [Actinoplanes rectilineatus]